MSAPLSPSGERPSRSARFPRALIAVTAATLAVRLVVGAHVHLTEDEAYYRLWSFAPALGYYDHPPMVAWWIWLGRQILGDTAVGVRLIPILANALTTTLVFDLARMVGANRQTAIRAGIWFNAMLLVGAGGLLAVPDAPASLFWTTCLWCALKAEKRNSTLWWLAAGCAAGLACLSKYSGLFLAPGMLLWLASAPERRARLRSPGPWIAAAAALLIFGLNLVWNAQHDWLTFAKQFGRVAGDGLAIQHLPEFLVGQALLLNPLMAPFLYGAWGAQNGSPARAINLSSIIATSAPFVAYLLIHSLHARVEAHWPAPIYPAIAICAAVGAEQLGGKKGWRALRAWVPVFGFVLCGLFAIALILPARWWPRTFDPGLPVQGWPAFVSELNQARSATGARWIGTLSYGLTAELSDEPREPAPVFQLNERARYNGLASAQPDFSRPGLIAELPRRVDLAILRRCFVTVQPLGFLARGVRGGASVRYWLVLVEGPRRPIARLGCS
jgi:4-amino-4-deoxy-L-arabinose transferase-like glycosyltransferase